MRRKVIISVLLVAAMSLVAACGGPNKRWVPMDKQNQAPAGQQPQPGQPAPTRKQWSQPPAMTIDTKKQYIATIVTSLGNIRIELFDDDAPLTVNNFVFLARQGFYDNLAFHRIIKGFMIQGGDPKGDGTGGPGYTIPDELPVKRSYDPGIVAMARTNKPNSAGSQFFICNGPACKNLDAQPSYVQFGKVIAGMEVLDQISRLEVKKGAEATPSTPVNPPKITTVIVEEK